MTILDNRMIPFNLVEIGNFFMYFGNLCVRTFDIEDDESEYTAFDFVRDRSIYIYPDEKVLVVDVTMTIE